MSIRNVIFIDSGISDPAPLISSIPADSLWFVLEDNRDGLQQMADKLAGLTELSSIQIVSHGAAGLLYLGSGTLGLGNLIPATPLLTRIGASLASGGDLLLYGCDVAQGSEGQKFVEQLAALTGANVAASADLSGPVGLGGNSVLEVATGSIESASLDLSRMKETLGAVVASNGHYYEVVNTPVTWTEALNAAAQKTYNGLTGYLVTITSTDEQTFLTNLVANNVTTGWDGKSAWIAASDANSEGSWKWVAGPEAGQLF